MPAPARTHVDLFAGAGGMGLGFELADFQPVFVSELHPSALDTYLRNRPDSVVHDPDHHALDLLEYSSSTRRLAELAERLGEVDVVTGGPPCQGFSGIGHRRTFHEVTRAQIPSNHLYKDMAKVIAALAPRAFVFENVRGLLSARWTPEGVKGKVWEDVHREFSRIRVRVAGRSIGYTVDWALVHGYEYAVPQNRPRVLLVGVREDLGFIRQAGERASGLLPPGESSAPDLEDVLGDLVDPDWGLRTRATTRYPRRPKTDSQRWFRTGPDGHELRILTEHEYSRHSDHVRERFVRMQASDGRVPPNMRTKKFAQRLLPRQWSDGRATITAASLPDDFVHFSQPRSLTVREWARLQTFPDWYQFSGSRTTGGRRRAGDPGNGIWTRELPKYTQIGNAVPVRLAEAVGRHLNDLLSALGA